MLAARGFGAAGLRAAGEKTRRDQCGSDAA
jgi:hypothetical protein